MTTTTHNPMKLTPYGMDTCCICDKPTTHAIPTEDNELLPYCAHCARAVKDEFPTVRVLLYSKGGSVTTTRKT